jgi:hypothetical protein
MHRPVEAVVDSVVRVYVQHVEREVIRAHLQRLEHLCV